MSNHENLNEVFEVLTRHFKDEEDKILDFFRQINEPVDSANYLFKPPVLWKSGTNYRNIKNENTFTVEISENPINAKRFVV